MKKITKMMQNKYLLFSWAFACCMALFGDAIADISTERISIQCCVNPDWVPVHEYSGEPNTQLTLVTEGLQVLGNSELIKDGFVNDIVVRAHCLSYYNGERLSDTTNIYGNMWPSGETLTCEKGDGLAITMISPNDQDPDRYHYMATLVRVRDETELTHVKNFSDVKVMRPQLIKPMFKPFCTAAASTI